MRRNCDNSVDNVMKRARFANNRTVNRRVRCRILYHTSLGPTVLEKLAALFMGYFFRAVFVCKVSEGDKIEWP